MLTQLNNATLANVCSFFLSGFCFLCICYWVWNRCIGSTWETSDLWDDRQKCGFNILSLNFILWSVGAISRLFLFFIVSDSNVTGVLTLPVIEYRPFNGGVQTVGFRRAPLTARYFLGLFLSFFFLLLDLLALRRQYLAYYHRALHSLLPSPSQTSHKNTQLWRS